MRRLFPCSPAARCGGSCFAADCTTDVVAAFEKQRTSKAFRVEFSQPTAESEAQMRIDYIQPDKMLQTVTSPAMPGELGRRPGLFGDERHFRRTTAPFTQSIVAEERTVLAPTPQKPGNFECLGPTKFDNGDLVAYRTAEKIPTGTDPAKVMARTIYVDPATGLPAFNIGAASAGTADPVMKVKYSYLTDIEIAAPQNAPAQKLR
jgi:hypothetical protein